MYTCLRNNILVIENGTAEDVINFLAENDPTDTFVIYRNNNLICQAEEF